MINFFREFDEIVLKFRQDFAMISLSYQNLEVENQEMRRKIDDLSNEKEIFLETIKSKVNSSIKAHEKY